MSAGLPDLKDMMQDAKGHWVPRALIKDVDLQRDELVRELVAKAKVMNARLEQFKREVQQDIQAFLDLSAERYGVQAAGAKGNVTLSTYDGSLRVIRAVADRVTFDERLQIAKQLIDQCITEWAKDSDNRIRALVEHAFQVDKRGAISTERVLGLRRLDISHPVWAQAMQAISDSLHVSSTRTYVRFYERADGDQYKAIDLDLSSV